MQDLGCRPPEVCILHQLVRLNATSFITLQRIDQGEPLPADLVSAGG
jgi:hypothetical protein